MARAALSVGRPDAADDLAAMVEKLAARDTASVETKE